MRATALFTSVTPGAPIACVHHRPLPHLHSTAPQAPTRRTNYAALDHISQRRHACLHIAISDVRRIGLVHRVCTAARSKPSLNAKSLFFTSDE